MMQKVDFLYLITNRKKGPNSSRTRSEMSSTQPEATIFLFGEIQIFPNYFSGVSMVLDIQEDYFNADRTSNTPPLVLRDEGSMCIVGEEEDSDYVVV